MLYNTSCPHLYSLLNMYAWKLLFYVFLKFIWMCHTMCIFYDFFSLNIVILMQDYEWSLDISFLCWWISSVFLCTYAEVSLGFLLPRTHAWVLIYVHLKLWMTSQYFVNVCSNFIYLPLVNIMGWIMKLSLLVAQNVIVFGLGLFKRC